MNPVPAGGNGNLVSALCAKYQHQNGGNIVAELLRWNVPNQCAQSLAALQWALAGQWWTGSPHSQQQTANPSTGSSLPPTAMQPTVLARQMAATVHQQEHQMKVRNMLAANLFHLHGRSQLGQVEANGDGEEAHERQLEEESPVPLGFSIDSLLGRNGAALKTEADGCGTTKTNYFKEERELSRTDGRRYKTTSRRAQTQLGKEKEGPGGRPNCQGISAAKQPPLPSSSVVGTGSRQSKHVCAECGKSYATSSNLSRHKQTHRPLDSPHAKKCPFCDRVYVSMPALSMHLLTHQARHKCPLCGKLFSRPWLLKGHLNTHSGQKPYGCANCGKAFSDKSNLRAHLSTHSSVKRWRCEHCGQAFTLKSYLSKHLEQKHGLGGRDAEMTSTVLPSLCEDEEEKER